MVAWWHHLMEIFSVLLALCAGTSLVTSEFPTQRPVMQNFDVFFDLCLNKWLSKQSWGWWFEMPLHSLWCHCNGLYISGLLQDIQLNKYDIAYSPSQIAKFMGPTCGPPGSCRPQMGPMLAPWTLLSGLIWMFIHEVVGPVWGNPLVTDGFPSKGPVTLRFYVFFDVIVGKLFSKQSSYWWFQMPWFPCEVTSVILEKMIILWWDHAIYNMHVCNREKLLFWSMVNTRKM